MFISRQLLLSYKQRISGRLYNEKKKACVHHFLWSPLSPLSCSHYYCLVFIDSPKSPVVDREKQSLRCSTQSVGSVASHPTLLNKRDSLFFRDIDSKILMAPPPHNLNGMSQRQNTVRGFIRQNGAILFSEEADFPSRYDPSRSVKAHLGIYSL